MSALEIKWGAPAYPRKGCLLAWPVKLLGPLLQDGLQWGNDPTPDEQRLAAAVAAERARLAAARRDALAKRLRGIRRRKSGGDSNA